ncbi:MAG: hypothetical protein ACRD9L_04140, partial [Bryobacteraceae bacterium]
MNADLSRRRMLQAAGATALWPASAPVAGASAEGMGVEGPDTPKLCLGISARVPAGRNVPEGWMDEEGMRRVKQLGVNHVLMGGPRIPWEEGEIRARMETLRRGGLSLGNMMIDGFPKTIYGRTGRDEEIDKVQKSIRAAGRAGLPVIEYNFYA